MTRRLRLDAIELDKVIQEAAFGEAEADPKVAVQARADDPAAFDASVGTYQRIDRNLREICAEAPARPTRSPLQEAFAVRKEREARRLRVRRSLDDRLIHFGVQDTLAHAAQNVARGAIGVAVAARGLGRILGTVGTTVNIVILNRIVAEVSEVPGEHGVIDVTPGEPEGSPA